MAVHKNKFFWHQQHRLAQYSAHIFFLNNILGTMLNDCVQWASATITKSAEGVNLYPRGVYFFKPGLGAELRRICTIAVCASTHLLFAESACTIAVCASTHLLFAESACTIAVCASTHLLFAESVCTIVVCASTHLLFAESTR